MSAAMRSGGLCPAGADDSWSMMRAGACTALTLATKSFQGSSVWPICMFMCLFVQACRSIKGCVWGRQIQIALQTITMLKSLICMTVGSEAFACCQTEISSGAGHILCNAEDVWRTTVLFQSTLGMQSWG